MKSLHRSFTATEALARLAAALLVGAVAVASATAGAQPPTPAGTVTHLDGSLLAQKADGRTRVIGQGAAVDVGDTVVTGNGAYAEIHFADGSDAILRPDTTLTLDAFSNDASRADGRSTRWTLAHGGMQVASGAIASSGRGHHTIATPLGTIDVAPSKFVMTVAAPVATPIALSRRVYLAQNSTGTMSDAQPPIILAQSFPLANPQGLKTGTPPIGASAPPPPPTGGTPAGPGGVIGAPIAPPVLAPGLHLQVTDGLIVVTNNGGSQPFQAGQFGFVPNVNQPPVIVPSNPGVQFVPPPSFGSGSGAAKPSTGPGGGQSVDCVVH